MNGSVSWVPADVDLQLRHFTVHIQALWAFKDTSRLFSESDYSPRKTFPYLSSVKSHFCLTVRQRDQAVACSVPSTSKKKRKKEKLHLYETNQPFPNYMPLFRQIHLLINATILKAREQLPTLNTTPPLLSLFWLCLIPCYNEGRVDDHHIFWMQRKQTLLKNSALRDEKIGIFKCTRACEKLACRNQSPSLQHIPVHINKLKVSNFRVSEYWGGIQHQQWNTELSDVRSWVGITSHLEKTLSRFLLLIRRRRAQTDSKDFPYLLLYSIYGESGFDRLMRVWSVFSACSLSLILPLL